MKLILSDMHPNFLLCWESDLKVVGHLVYLLYLKVVHWHLSKVVLIAMWILAQSLAPETSITSSFIWCTQAGSMGFPCWKALKCLQAVYQTAAKAAHLYLLITLYSNLLFIHIFMNQWNHKSNRIMCPLCVYLF